MIDPDTVPVSTIEWQGAVRIIRSIHPPIDLFEDIADPADWPLLISAEQKTNPRLMENIGNLDLVPQERRVGGPGATYLMAPFTHVSHDRPTRFSDGSHGVLYAGNSFEVAATLAGSLAWITGHVGHAGLAVVLLAWPFLASARWLRSRSVIIWRNIRPSRIELWVPC